MAASVPLIQLLSSSRIQQPCHVLLAPGHTGHGRPREDVRHGWQGHTGGQGGMRPRGPSCASILQVGKKGPGGEVSVPDHTAGLESRLWGPSQTLPPWGHCATPVGPRR